MPRRSQHRKVCSHPSCLQSVPVILARRPNKSNRVRSFINPPLLFIVVPRLMSLESVQIRPISVLTRHGWIGFPLGLLRRIVLWDDRRWGCVRGSRSTFFVRSLFPYCKAIRSLARSRPSRCENCFFFVILSLH